MVGLQAKSMTSQRPSRKRWRICVTMATLRQQQDGGYVTMATLRQQQDGGYALPWKR